ncbi:MAG: hypothetical protein ACK5NT_04380 [Pyrinomonadaceae bacterium]
MGQNGKVRQGDGENILRETELATTAPLGEQIKTTTKDDEAHWREGYDFKAELSKDNDAEKRLLRVELVLILILVAVGFLRDFLLQMHAFR